MFHRWITQYIRLSLVGGRIVGTPSNGPWMFGNSQQNFGEGQVREHVAFNGNGTSGSLAYTYQRGGGTAARNGPVVEFGIDINSEGRFELRYSDKDHPEKYFKFTQVAGQPVSLSLPPPDKPRVLQAPTAWHLLIIHREDCGKHFLPVLEAARPAWNLDRMAQAIEDELVKMAAVSHQSDRKQWDAWVNQLSDPLYQRRSKADQNLQKVGPAILGYLNRLDMGRLDAEQKSRLGASSAPSPRRPSRTCRSAWPRRSLKIRWSGWPSFPGRRKPPAGPRPSS